VSKRELQELASELAPRAARLVRLLVRERAGASRTQLSVLASLRDGGPQRITDLARGEHVTQPTMTTLVARLDRQGWVERRPDPDDGRVVNVALTRAGRTALRDLGDATASALAKRLAALEPAELAALAAAVPVLDKLIDL
jgi:DNA-binding MarR family transcriptional regulator